MKKYLNLFIVLLLVFGYRAHASIVIGNELGANISQAAKAEINTSDESEANAKVKRAEVRTAIEVKKSEGKARLEELKNQISTEKDLVKAKVEANRIALREKALTDFEEAVQKISTIKTRVDIQIASVSTKGVDVTAALAFEAAAEASLNAASLKILEAHEILTATTEELTSKDKVGLLQIGKTIQSALRDAQKSLNNAVKSLKDGVQAKIKAELAAHAASETSTKVEDQDN